MHKRSQAYSRTLFLDFLPAVTLCVPEAVWGARGESAEEWVEDEEAWEGWSTDGYAAAAQAAALLNHAPLRHLLQPEGGEEEDMDKARGGGRGGGRGEGGGWQEIPVVVMNQAEANGDRRQHMQRLTEGMRFVNVSFPATRRWSSLDLAALVEAKQVSPLLWPDARTLPRGLALSQKFYRFVDYGEGLDGRGALMYMANALDHLEHIRAAARNNHPVIVLEDDLLVASADALVARRQLEEAAAALPSTADMLFLEYCFETCERLKYAPHTSPTDAPHSNRSPTARKLARAHAPSCSAAVLFTIRGAKRVARLAAPVFDVIDRMYQFLVVSGLVEAYLITPPLFFQDAFWGSSWQRTTETWQHATHRVHKPLKPACGGYLAALRFRESEVEEVGVALSQPHLASLAPLLGGLCGGWAAGEAEQEEGLRRCAALNLRMSRQFGEETEEVEEIEALYVYVPRFLPWHLVQRKGGDKDQERERAGGTNREGQREEGRQREIHIDKDGEDGGSDEIKKWRALRQEREGGSESERETEREREKEELGLRVVLYLESVMDVPSLIICSEWYASSPPPQGLLLRIEPETACFASIKEKQKRKTGSSKQFETLDAKNPFKIQGGTVGDLGGRTGLACCKFSAALKSESGSILSWSDTYLYIASL